MRKVRLPARPSVRPRRGEQGRIAERTAERGLGGRRGRFLEELCAVFLDELPQGGAPVVHHEQAGLAEAAVVEDRIGGPRRRRRILRRRARSDFVRDADERQKFVGELRPVREALRHGVAHAERALCGRRFDDRGYLPGEAQRPGRAAPLVRHHARRVFGVRERQAEHGLGEIPAVRAVEPRRAQYRGGAAGLEDGPLARQFRAPVGGARGGRCGFVCGLRDRQVARQDVIRGDVHEERPRAPAVRGKRRRAVAVGPRGALLLLFGGIDRGPRRAVHHGFVPEVVEEGGQARVVGDVRLRKVAEPQFVRRKNRRAVRSELPAAASYQNSHRAKRRTPPADRQHYQTPRRKSTLPPVQE